MRSFAFCSRQVLPSSSPSRGRSQIVDGRLRSRRTLAGMEIASIVLIAALGGFVGLLAWRTILLPQTRVAEAATDIVSAAPRLGAQYVGRWVSETGMRILISKSGAVWIDDGAMLGDVLMDSADASRVVLAGTGFRCAYQVTFKGADTSDWQLTGQQTGSSCPKGRFDRPFFF